MEKELYIDASHPTETRVVVKSNNHIEEYEYENKLKTHIKNNIYYTSAKVQITQMHVTRYLPV